MTTDAEFDAWTAGQSYDRYMGRWSAAVAERFLDWLEPPGGARWVEAGCGTGALTSAILRRCAPASVLATDASAEFAAHARAAISDPRARFATADAADLPAEDGSADIVASGLVLNFLPDRLAGLAEMRRVLRPGGLLSFYAWDYPGGGIGFLDAFWQAAAALDPAAAALDEGARFPFCTRDGLAALLAEAGIGAPAIAPIEIVTEFPDFEAFWQPFTLGAGPAPGYCTSLPPDRREALKTRLAERLGAGRPVSFRARAWAVKARMPT
ncbi:class I SAM-dependent methyltransferase [Poseidonocella sp. HB161398]|uniref:class I SAM-dependent methyltransferase n=1 Tax=Poseidonocella sp. HB161398 TaxID=2320855 RepID=UPI001108FC4C|nr:class I SAM-dependent methyltransferase [Poseidonocella sp. HB161398]